MNAHIFSDYFWRLFLAFFHITVVCSYCLLKLILFLLCSYLCFDSTTIIILLLLQPALVSHQLIKTLQYIYSSSSLQSSPDCSTTSVVHMISHGQDSNSSFIFLVLCCILFVLFFCCLVVQVHSSLLVSPPLAPRRLPTQHLLLSFYYSNIYGQSSVFGSDLTNLNRCCRD